MTDKEATSVLRLRIASDLHFEFHADNGKSFVESLKTDGTNVLILAGDISNAAGIEQALCLLCDRFSDVPVLYVNGNHELYGASPSEFYFAMDRARYCCKNLHWLNRDIVTIKGQRFLGTTLWFEEHKRAPTHYMNDFHVIKDFVPWVYEENKKNVNFLRANVRKDDVVITHHLPSYDCVAPQYVGNPLNPFFVCDMDKVIDSKEPALWVFGHTHSSVDKIRGKTRLLCNPFGYVEHELNREFNDDLIVEVWP